MKDNRTAATPIQEKSQKPEETVYHKKETSVEHTEAMPLEIYEKERKEPYLVGVFELSNYHDLKKQPEGDVDSLLEKIEMIDSFLKGRIMERNMESSQESYKFLIDEIFNSIGSLKTESGISKLKRLASYIKNTQLLTEKELEIKRIKEQLYGNR